MNLEGLISEIPHRFHTLQTLMEGVYTQTLLERISKDSSVNITSSQNSFMKLTSSRHLNGAIRTFKTLKNRLLSRNSESQLESRNDTEHNKSICEHDSYFGHVQTREPSSPSEMPQYTENDEHSFSISLFAHEGDWPGSGASDFFFPLGIEEILQVRPIIRYLVAQFEDIKISNLLLSWIVIIKGFRDFDDMKPINLCHERVARISAFLKLVAQRVWKAAQSICRNRHLTKRAYWRVKQLAERLLRPQSSQLKFENDLALKGEDSSLLHEPNEDYLEVLDQKIYLDTDKNSADEKKNKYTSSTRTIISRETDSNAIKRNGELESELNGSLAKKDSADSLVPDTLTPSEPLLSRIPYDLGDQREVTSHNQTLEGPLDEPSVRALLKQSHCFKNMILSPDIDSDKLKIGCVKCAKTPIICPCGSDPISKNWADIFLARFNRTSPECAQQEFEAPDTNDNTLTEDLQKHTKIPNADSYDLEFHGSQHQNYSSISYLQSEAWSETGAISHEKDLYPLIYPSVVPCTISPCSSKDPEVSWVPSPILNVIKLPSNDTINHNQCPRLETSFLPSSLNPSSILPMCSQHEMDIVPSHSVIDAFAIFAPMNKDLSDTSNESSTRTRSEVFGTIYTESISDDVSSLVLLKELEAGVLNDSSEEHEGLAEKCRRKLFCFTPMWTQANLLLLEFEDDGSFAVRSPLLTIRFADEADIWSEGLSCNEKRSISQIADRGQKSLSRNNSKLSASPLTDPKINWEQIGVDIKKDEAEALKGILKNYRRVFVHLTNNVVMPCNESIKILIKEILAVRQMTGDIFSQTSGISCEVSMISEILEETDVADRSYWHNRIQKCSHSLAILDMEMQQVQNTLNSLKSGFESRLACIASTIGKIKTIRDRILTKYFFFYEQNESRGTFGLQNVHQCTLVHEYKQRTLWHYLVDINELEMFLTKTICALESSYQSVSELITQIYGSITDMSQTKLLRDRTLS